MGRSELIAAAAIFFCGGGDGLLGTVEGRVLGAFEVAITAESDRCLSIPLRRLEVVAGVVAGVDKGKREVRVEGLTEGKGDALSQSGRPHYLLIKDGPGEGLGLSILSSAGDTVVVEAGEEEFGLGVIKGVGVGIIPHWTVETAFPDVPEGTVLMLFNEVRTGINLAADQVLIQLSGHWHDAVTLDPAGDTILFPGESFVLRNAGKERMDLAINGMVPMEGHHADLRTCAEGVSHDNRIGWPFPVEVPVGDMGIPARRGDMLLAFDPEEPGTNPSASSVLMYADGAWYDAFSFADVSDSYLVQPCQGLIFRKAARDAAETVIWKPVPPYLKP